MADPDLRTRIDGVVIGASAGGVEALSVLLPALPRSLHAPVFIVLHLPRERPSLLVDIFAPKCALPVREAADKEPIEPGVVYFAPPDYHLLLDGSEHGGAVLSLSDDELVNFSRPSIDVLFESAADLFGNRLLGIILTGANEDGAAGLASIHDAGGITIAQDPDTAAAYFMPRAATLRSPVDMVLSIQEIAGLLGTLGEAS